MALDDRLGGQTTETRDGMCVDWDVAIEMDDGLVLRGDVFRPIAPGKYPVILTYGPYAKGLSFQAGYPSAWNAMAKNHRDNRVRSEAAPVHRAHDREHVVGGRPERPEALHLAGEDVEQHLGVGAGVQMPEILAHEHLGQLGGVGEVAVVREADAVR